MSGVEFCLTPLQKGIYELDILMVGIIVVLILLIWINIYRGFVTWRLKSPKVQKNRRLRVEYFYTEIWLNWLNKHLILVEIAALSMKISISIIHFLLS